MSSQPPKAATRRATFPQLLWIQTMADKSQQPQEREGTISALNAAIEAMNLAKEYHACQSCFWFRQRCPRNDQSGFPSGILLTDCRLTEIRLGRDDQSDGLC